MALQLPGFLKTIVDAVFADRESVEQEALRVSRTMLRSFSGFDDSGRQEVATSWFGSTKWSKQNKTGIDHISRLISSGKEENMSIAAQVLKDHGVFMVACAHSSEENPAPHEWVAKMTQSPSVFVRDVAFDLISDFELDDIPVIRQAMGIEEKRSVFVDSRDLD